MDVESLFPSESDLDLSFTSCASNTSTDRTFTSSSARSSLTLSFNESRGLSSSSGVHRPHRKSDPHWTAIHAATNLSPDGTIHLNHLKLLRHLGSGNLGRVFLCRLKDYDDSATFALKVIDREALTNKKLSHVMMESQVLSVVDHPFLPTLYAHLEVSHYTCLLIDYCPGGDLHSLLRKQPGNRFRVDAVRFFASEVLVGLEYLHALGVVYRDLKPENILIREDGHVMLSDFDLCFTADVVPTLFKRFSSKVGPTKKNWLSCLEAVFRRRKEISDEEMTAFVAEPTAAYSRCCVGTHEYLAPELVNGNGHGNGVDWWAFGIFLYELLYGRTPFKGATKEATLRNIASSRPFGFPESDVAAEENGVAEVKDLIARLLVKDPRRRLGCAWGAADIKRHPFFDGIKWPLIRTYSPPDVPGLMRKKSHVSHVRGGGSSFSLSRRKSLGKRWSWRGIGNFIKGKGSDSKLNKKISM
ncbi:Protein kinase domain [Macleaya cordata]|uniref:non-specific serine/threonine protein kinase n=1 Tax=Macleaya cordata TaxID=56857 RepID=A0A200PNG2_MACCD|nr:Protein kinase domain [Macleaya cordata]